MARLWIGIGAAVVLLAAFWGWSAPTHAPRSQSVAPRANSPLSAPVPSADSAAVAEPGHRASAARVRGAIVVDGGAGAEPEITIREEGADAWAERREPGAFALEYERALKKLYELHVDAPGARPVTVPLPTGDEDVGTIVLQPTLTYRGVVLLDGEPLAGVRVGVVDQEGAIQSTSPVRTDSRGRFALKFRDAPLLSQNPDGGYLNYFLHFEHPESSFEPVRARPEGWMDGHLIELAPATTEPSLLQLSSRADGVPIATYADTFALQDLRPTKVDAGLTRDGGYFAPRGGYRVRVGFPPDWIHIDLGRLKRPWPSPVVLNVAEPHVAELRVLREGRPVPGAEVRARTSAGTLSGTSDEEGRITFRIGAVGDGAAQPIEFHDVLVLYRSGDQLLREFVDLIQGNGRARRSIAPILVRVGRAKPGRTSIWFTCRGDDGKALTPRRLLFFTRTESGPIGGLPDTLLGSQPYRFDGGVPIEVDPRLAGRSGLYEGFMLSFPREEFNPHVGPAMSGFVLLDTVERGQHRFEFTIDAWKRASSVAAPLEFVFPPIPNRTRRLRVVGPRGTPVPNAVVACVATTLPAYRRHSHKWTFQTDARGEIGLEHLPSDERYEIFVHHPVDGRTGFADNYDPGAAAEETSVVLRAPVRFEATVRLDTDRVPSLRNLTIMLCSRPQGLLPTVYCAAEGDRVVGMRPAGLEGYELVLVGTTMRWGKLELRMPAAEALGKTLEFPPQD